MIIDDKQPSSLLSAHVRSGVVGKVGMSSFYSAGSAVFGSLWSGVLPNAQRGAREKLETVTFLAFGIPGAGL
jgi:hypothetical protein